LTSEKLFDTLKDGAWHNLNELARQIGAPVDKLVVYARSLSEQGIVKFEEATQRMRIEPEWKILIPNDIEQTKKNSD
jgi:predicted transcriptional regulator